MIIYAKVKQLSSRWSFFLYISQQENIIAVGRILAIEHELHTIEELVVHMFQGHLIAYQVS